MPSVTDRQPFAIVPEWLLYSPVSANAIRLYAVLHRHAGPHGAYPSNGRLCELMGVAENTVRRALDELSKIGAVEVRAHFDENGRQTSNDYILDPRGPIGGTHEGPMGGTHEGATGGTQTRAIGTRPTGTTHAREGALAKERPDGRDQPAGPKHAGSLAHITRYR